MAEVRRARESAAPSPGPRRFGWAPFLAAALALAMFAVFYFSGREKQFAEEAVALREQLRRQNIALTRWNEALAILGAPGATETAFGADQPAAPRGRVFVNPRGVLLIAGGLPPAPDGKAYEMWRIPRDGSPVPAGLFRSQGDGAAMHVWRGAVDVGATAAITVTLEDEAGAAQPTSPPLIVAPVL